MPPDSTHGSRPLTPQIQAEVDALVFNPPQLPRLSHQQTQPEFVRRRCEGLIDKDTESHFVKGGNTLRADANAGNSFDAVFNGHEGEVLPQPSCECPRVCLWSPATTPAPRTPDPTPVLTPDHPRLSVPTTHTHTSSPKTQEPCGCAQVTRSHFQSPGSMQLSDEADAGMAFDSVYSLTHAGMDTKSHFISPSSMLLEASVKEMGCAAWSKQRPGHP